VDSNNICLTEEQKLILKNCNSNLYISSSPGSGKSTMLSKISEKLLASPKNFLMLVTFTNKASKSIIDKCTALDQTRILGGTFHGLSYRFMKQTGLDLYICDESKKRLIIKKIFNCYKDKEKFERMYDIISKGKARWPRIESSIITKYNDELKKYSLMDFDDIIYFGIDIFINPCVFPDVTHILVDELQDTSAPQLELLRSWQKKTNAKMIGVADDDQCQPGSTEVLTTTGYKRMDSLDSNTDKLVSFINKGSYIGGLKNGYSFDITSRDYNDRIITISCNNKLADCTPNHKWLVRWSEKAKNKNVVYLMRKGDRYRIGWCQLFNSEGAFHLGTRARAEKADAAWIIEVCNTKREASICETMIAFSHGIPTITFEQSTGSYYDKKAVDIIYYGIGTEKIKKRALELLKNARLKEEYPIWSKTIAYQKRGGAQRFKLQACNLKKELFEIPVHTKGKKFEWKEIENIWSYKKTHSVKMYSLNVKVGKDNGENSKTYICNQGLVTGNSIYAWRGARPKNVWDFITDFKCITYNMGYNFRSAQRIVTNSRSLIVNNIERIKKIIRPFRKEQGVVSEYRCSNQFEEIDYVIMRCLQHRDREIAILYRNRTFKNHLEFALRKASLEYTVNDFLEITDRSAIKVMLSVLKICTREFDLYDLQNAAKAIKGFGNATVLKLEKESDAGNPVSRIFYLQSIDEKKNKRLKHLLELQKFYEDNLDSNLEGLVREIENHFNKSFDYAEEMRAFLIDISRDYKIASGAIKRLNNELGLNGKEEHSDKNAKIELSTVHGYKGLERDIVILPWCESYLEQRPGKEIKLEEERRLFYVAATRAMNKLYMCYIGDIPQFIMEMKL